MVTNHLMRISSLEASPLIEILKKGYGNISHFSLRIKRKEIEENAWGIVLDPTTYVYGVIIL